MVVNVVALSNYSNASQELTEQQSMTIKTKNELQGTSERLQAVEQEKMDTASSLKEERLKTENLEEENQSLKANLQAKKERESKLASAQVAPKQNNAAPVARVSGNCGTWLAKAGITHPIAVDLIQRESGCEPCIVNGGAIDCNYSGDRAYGIPQALPGHKMSSHGSDWKTNPVTQLRWMQDYVMGRYGSWEEARAHHDVNNWY